MPVSQVFISYSHHDTTFAHVIENSLANLGITVWVDRQRLVGGSAWRDDLQEAIQTCDAFLLVMSPQALNSAEVRKEYQLALSINKPVVPLVHKRVRAAPAELRAAHWLDCSGHRVGRGVLDLLATLNALGIPMAVEPGVFNVDDALLRVIHHQVPAGWRVYRVSALRYRRRRDAASWAAFLMLALTAYGAVALSLYVFPAVGGLGLFLAILVLLCVVTPPVGFFVIVRAFYMRLISLQYIPEVVVVTPQGFAIVERRFWGTTELRIQGYSFGGVRRLEVQPARLRRARLKIWSLSAAPPVTISIPAKFSASYEIARMVNVMFQNGQRGTSAPATGNAPAPALTTVDVVTSERQELA